MISLSEKSFFKIGVALTIYITSLFAANTLGLKIMPFLFGSHISVGVFSFPIVFIMTDVIGEVYGKKMARLFVLSGFISIVLFMLYSLLSLTTPWAQAGLWAKDGYNLVFGLSLRISLASLMAFIIGEYQDVITFFFLKNKLGDKHFWIRSNLSNLWSQFLDTVIFMTIAFVGVYSWKNLLFLILTWWIYKVLLGLLYTPLSYLGIKLLKDKELATTSIN